MATDLTAVKGFILSLVRQFNKTIIKQGVDSSNGPKTRWPLFPDFHKRILFSDEAHFWLNGYVNKQNGRIWSEANPQVYVETKLHPEKLTVWSCGSNKTVQHVTQLVPQIDLLKDTFGERLISRFGPMNWPPRSCDLTPLDYFLVGLCKVIGLCG
ncbi:uncharacterized protein TNCV_377991 [Trichonephila clavipes]|nr:uncharacterized protein TNCV_377991 [Trichonephila clavipes]